MRKEARFWNPLDDSGVQCCLCPHNCTIADGNRGLCGVRANEGGRLFSRIYGEVTGSGLDPIEKKPLYHFYPSREILSLGTKGCNFKCPFCQNWHISQKPDGHSTYLSPEDAVNAAVQHESFGISYTYSEPLIWIEYVMDTSELAHEKGLKNVLVTNGFINEGPLEELLPLVDAANIDVKSFDPEFYRKLCKGQLDPVLRTCEKAAGRWHIEITNLIVPFKSEHGILDDIVRMCDWIAGRLGRGVPLHFSRYVPNYKFDLPATPVALMERARNEALERLDFVYLGNVAAGEGSDTKCPNCGDLLIERSGYSTIVRDIRDSKCGRCGYEVRIPGV
jgi:pyruvate formate lyase activating enzyme